MTIVPVMSLIVLLSHLDLMILFWVALELIVTIFVIEMFKIVLLAMGILIVSFVLKTLIAVLSEREVFDLTN